MSSKRRIAVGLFVVGGFFLFALGLFWIGDRRLLFSESVELETAFSNLSGLKPGAKVMVSGMDAGEVLTIQVPPAPGQKFRVRFRVLANFLPILRADSVASIQVEGLVGSKVLQVDTGSETAAGVRAGATLPGREPIEIGAIIQQAVDMIEKVDGAVDDVQGRLIKTINTITDVGEQAQKMVVKTSSDVGEVMATGKKVANDVNILVTDVRKGRGVVGKLLTDDKLYTRIDSTVQHFETTAANVRQTSEDVKKIAADVESRKLGETLQTTAVNVQEATARLKEIMAELRPPGGTDQHGLLDDVRASLENTREATSDLAENMEALKRNWFFRGYFNRRGFYDLDAVSLEEYRQGKVAPKRGREERWLAAGDLFKRDPGGREVLADAGLAEIGEAMVPYLRHSPNTLLMVEGYATGGTETERFIRSRDRAQLVRRYLIDRFGLKPNFVGAMPMGALPPVDPTAPVREGVALVFFPEKK